MGDYVTETIFPPSTTPLNPANHFNETQLLFFQVGLSVISAAGVFGNLLIAAVVLTDRRWQAPSNIFLANIAIADLIICFWTLPIMVTSINQLKWPLPDWLCDLGGFLDNASYACSAWSLALGALERFYLVLSRGKKRENMTHSVAILFAGSVWLFSIILASLPVIGWNRYVYSPLTFSCAINAFMDGVHKFYFIVYLVLVLPGPLMIITFCYGYIFFFICRLPKRNNSERNNHLSAVLPLVCITCAFLLCSAPTTVIVVILLVSPGHKLGSLHPLHYNIIHWFMLADSCLNPMLCAFTSKRFRGASKDLLVYCSHYVYDYLAHTFSVDEGFMVRVKYRLIRTWDDFVTKIRKNIKVFKKSLVKTLCPKIFQSTEDSVVIKVTINNQTGTSMDPLLSAHYNTVEQGLTQMTSLTSSKTESFKRQSSSESARRPSTAGSVEGVNHAPQPGGMSSRRTSGDRNPFVNDVIHEEVEPILIWCTCGLNRCRCIRPHAATPV